MLIRSLSLIAVIASIAACSSTRYCAREQSYEKSVSIPPIVAPEGLKLPATSTALKVPEPRGESLSFAYLTPDPAKPGKNKVQCLDQPPPIPPLSDNVK